MFDTQQEGEAIEALLASLEVLRVDQASLDARSLRRAVAVVHAARGVLDTALVHLADHARRLEAAGVGAPAEEAMLGNCTIPARVAHQHVHRSELADALPLVGQAIREGRANPDSVDHLHRAWIRLDEVEQAEFIAVADAALAERVGITPPDVFARTVRLLARSVTADDGLADHQAQVDASSVRVQRCHNGMRRFILELDPIRADEIEADVNAAARSILQRHAEVDDRTDNSPNLRAEAMHALIRGGALHPTGGLPRSTSISIVCDQHTAHHGPHADTVCETVGGDAVPHGLLQRLACDASVAPLLIGADGMPFDAGRSYRTATTRQKQALRALYPVCPLSGTPFRDCEIHHVTYWEDGGPTDLGNLIPISRRWHHLIHDHRWRLELHPDRSIDLYRPDGRHHRHVPPPIPITRPGDRQPVGLPIAA
jgi:hypothetical protein